MGFFVLFLVQAETAESCILQSRLWQLTAVSYSGGCNSWLLSPTVEVVTADCCLLQWRLWQLTAVSYSGGCDSCREGRLYRRMCSTPTPQPCWTFSTVRGDSVTHTTNNIRYSCLKPVSHLFSMWVAKWQYASGPIDRNAMNNNTPSPAKKEALQQFAVVEKENWSLKVVTAWQATTQVSCCPPRGALKSVPL